MEIADGGNGCTPAFPPRQYWGWKYQSAEAKPKWPHGMPVILMEHELQRKTDRKLDTDPNIHRYPKRVCAAWHVRCRQTPGMYPMPEAIPPGQVAARAMADGGARTVNGYVPNTSHVNSAVQPLNQPSIIEEAIETPANPPVPFGSGVGNESPVNPVQ